MASESTPKQTDPAVTNGEASEQKSQRERRQHTPPEELYDLTKPIPKVDKPNKEAHEAEVEAINSKIDELKAAKGKLQDKIASVLDSKRDPAANKERQAVKDLRQSKHKLIDEKKVLQNQLARLKKDTDDLVNGRKAAKANVRFSSVEKIDEEIKKLKERQETTSMSLMEEKTLIKEIESLQKSKDLVVSFEHTDATIVDSKEQRKLISAQLKAKDTEIDAIQSKIDEKQKELDAEKNSKDEQRKGVDDMRNERAELTKQIGDKMKERNDARDAFREANNKWYDYQRALKAQKKIQYEEEKKKREEEDAKKLAEWEAEEAKKIPYEFEQDLCQYLADHLTRTYITESETKDSSTKTDDVVPLADNPFAGFKPRARGDEDEMFLQVGKGKKQPRVRASKKKAAPVFKLTVDAFDKFGVLGLNPPTSVEGVQKSVDELIAKKEWYSKQPRGSVPTANDIREANMKEAQKISKDKTAKKKNGKIDISSADFAPLSIGSSTAAMNSTWGQKATEEDIAVAPTGDANVEASA